MVVRRAASVVAVGVCAGTVGTGCGGSGAVALDRSFARTVEGMSVKYPTSWQLTTRNDNSVPDPALCFDLEPKADSRVDLRVVEYLPPFFNPRDLPNYRPRPTHFRLASFRKGDGNWSRGKITSFREHRRVFYVGVVLPATAGQAIRHTVEQILDSLRIAPQGRCRPTSGVGSHGVPNPFPKSQKSSRN
jgi:hypothetical protein